MALILFSNSIYQNTSHTSNHVILADGLFDYSGWPIVAPIGLSIDCAAEAKVQAQEATATDMPLPGPPLDDAVTEVFPITCSTMCNNQLG